MLEYKKCLNQKEIYDFVSKILKNSSLPKKKNALIFIKPNMNNEINALMGGTTDLRLIYAVLEYLTKEGYTNLVVGDGPNVGAYHGKVNVFSRLKLDKICEIFKVKLIDLNYEDYNIVKVGKRKIKVAKICFDAEYFINLPKIKCHIETGMSISLKNLVGVCRGYEKRKMHWDLNNSLIHLNEVVKPNLHIIDGLVIMEGDGPSAGFPRLLNYLIAGNNSYEVDMVCSKLVGFNGFKTLEGHEVDVNVNKIIEIKEAKKNVPSKVLLKNYFVIPRYWKPFDLIISSRFIHNILLKAGIRQTPFVKEDDNITNVYASGTCGMKCNCSSYCPLSLHYWNKKDMERCIKCLYCYLTCQENTIKIEGELGYLKPLIEKYGLPIKGIK